MRLRLLVPLALVLAACGNQSTATQSPPPTTPPSIVTIALPTTPTTAVQAATNTPIVPTVAQPTPTDSLSELPTPPPAQPTVSAEAALSYYVDPSGWSLDYPANFLHKEDLGNGVTVFVSSDRGAIVAVDSYVAEGDQYGNTGEDLRNRARDTLAAMYGRPVENTLPLEQIDRPWETGISFTTAKGSAGQAVYSQPGRSKGDMRVYGFLIGLKVARQVEELPALLRVRDSFKAAPVAAVAPSATPHPATARLLYACDTGLCTVNSDGSGQQTLAAYDPKSQPLHGYGWSPDGKTVAYAVETKAGAADVVLLKPETGEANKLFTVTGIEDGLGEPIVMLP